MKDQNVIAVLKKREFLAGFSRLLKIVRQNKQILFQRGIQQHLIKNISGSFVIDNDPLDITTYSNLVTNYLLQRQPDQPGRQGKAPRRPARAPGQRDRARQLQDQLRREDGLAGAEPRHHGPDPEEERGSGHPGPQGLLHLYHRAGAARSSRSGTRARASTGESRLAAQPNEPGLHGMGMMMAKLYVQDLGYNEAGNEVCFEVEHQKNESNVIPGIFVASPELRLRGRAVHLLRGRGIGLSLLHRLGTALRLFQGQAGLGPDPGRHLHGRDVLSSCRTAGRRPSCPRARASLSGSRSRISSTS